MRLDTQNVTEGRNPFDEWLGVTLQFSCDNNSGTITAYLNPHTPGVSYST